MVTASAAPPEHSAPLDRAAWSTFAPRDELLPAFEFRPEGGPDRRGGLVIRHDQREGLDGAWKREYPIEGGKHYRLTAAARPENLTDVRYQVYAELLFHDQAAQLVLDETLGVASRPLYPPVVDRDARPWLTFSGIFRAPLAATHATVKLQLRHAPGGSVEWGQISLDVSPPRTPRPVRLAAANYRPRGGKSARDNLLQLRPHVARAEELNADLLVLGECINSVGTGLSREEVAEPVPGPSTKLLGEMAQQHHLYLVTTIHERVEHLIYNTAVLISPEGQLVGTYRKVCPARDEYRGGVACGDTFPVFTTPLGRIGMMICYDVHMPEVARGLAANGAEIIALPIMGGHPQLAQARAIENQIYLVTSTYSINDDWMQSGVWGPDGQLLVRATERDSVVFTQVDMAQQHFWRANMGDFQGRLYHERPIAPLPR